jgi:hypothetical protein
VLRRGVASCAGMLFANSSGEWCIAYLMSPFNELVNVDLAKSRHILLRTSPLGSAIVSADCTHAMARNTLSYSFR